MLKLLIKFDEPIFLFAFLLFAALSALWVGLELRAGRTRRLLVPFLLINLAALLYWAASTGIDEDETEALHTTWMVTQGMTPYVDFWQHHLPMIWVLATPIVRLVGPSPAVYVASRLVAMALALLIGWLGWRLARRIWRDEASLATYAFLFLAGAGFWEYARLRADLPMVALLLAGVLAVVDMAEGHRGGAFRAGLFIALGLTFTVKHAVTVLLPVAVIFLDGHRDHVRRLALYAAGGLLGVLPMAIFLLRHGVVDEFRYWVIRFNAGETVAEASVPVGLLIVAVIAVRRLLHRRRHFPEPVHAVILIAFALASWASLFAVPQAFGYYLAYWMLLVAVIGAGLSLPQLAGGAGGQLAGGPGRRRARILAAGCMLALLTAPNIHFANTGRVARFQSELGGMRVFLTVADDRPVLMFNPEHPIFARDATRLYTRWQLRFIDGPGDRALIEAPSGPPLVDAIVANRPAIVSRIVDGYDWAETLLSTRTIEREDYDRFQAFLDANYTPKKIGKYPFWVLNERAHLVPERSAGGGGAGAGTDMPRKS